MVSAAVLSNRKMVAGLVVGIAALVVVMLWFFADGFSTSVVDYLNLHGGYALVLFWFAAIAAGIVAYIQRGHALYLFGFILLLAIVASFVGMTIELAA